MDAKLKDKFIENWGRYFPGIDLPFALFYSDDEKYWDDLRPQEGFGCMIAHFAPVLKGERVAFAEETIACPGGVRYSGFPTKPNPGMNHFLSCGIPGEMEGLRLKKTPELVEGSFGEHTLAEAGEGSWLPQGSTSSRLMKHPRSSPGWPHRTSSRPSSTWQPFTLPTGQASYLPNRQVAAPS